MPLWAFITILILILVIFVEVLFIISFIRKNQFCVFDQSPRCFNDWTCKKWWEGVDPTQAPAPGPYPWPAGLSFLDGGGAVSGDEVDMKSINTAILNDCTPKGISEKKCGCIKSSELPIFKGNNKYGGKDGPDTLRDKRVGPEADLDSGEICTPLYSLINNPHRPVVEPKNAILFPQLEINEIE